eukprot:2030128-Ditylum_brightwellii.AAC.1
MARYDSSTMRGWAVLSCAFGSIGRGYFTGGKKEKETRGRSCQKSRKGHAGMEIIVKKCHFQQPFSALAKNCKSMTTANQQQLPKPQFQPCF